MVSYVATLDVLRHVVDYLSRLLAACRRRLRTPRGSRAIGPFRQAVLVLRWFREHTSPAGATAMFIVRKQLPGA